jgi:hypothetical protein
MLHTCQVSRDSSSYIFFFFDLKNYNFDIIKYTDIGIVRVYLFMWLWISK